MPGKSTIDAIFTMRVSLQKRFRFQKDTRVLFVDFVKALDTVTVPREMLFKVLARLGFPPKIANLVRVFHENVTLEVDLDDDGNTIRDDPRHETKLHTDQVFLTGLRSRK
jgi:hypothetical protein